MAHTREEKLAQFGRVLDIMDKLREKCPWNGAQTWETLRSLTVEEVYELSDAVIKHEDKDVEKELGDILLHVVFYSKVAEEQSKFDVADVMERLCEKMTFRHPHVFADGQAADAEAVSENWEMMKMKEKGGNKRILSGVPDSLPPILKAYSMQDKARGVGFDWERPSQVWDKVKEEQGEFQAELESMSAEEGLGDTTAQKKNSGTSCLLLSMLPDSMALIRIQLSTVPATSSVAVSLIWRNIPSVRVAILPT